ncbi:transglutaminase-like domain-containing protein [Sphaerisporangium corydalis]|uniref:Transglutaminase-like domain-containing protein n=1 Tax=Sphaerisporangium corydalis TaxID=1441875 RepID=A0ABV9EB81_9ACTN|nr:transglutaminase domain-containing protein [Sphaerisporangium corydalis]
MADAHHALEAEERAFYLAHSVFSDPGDLSRLDGIPSDPAELALIVRNLLIHREETSLFGFTLPDNRKNEAETRYVSAILSIITERNDTPLTVARPPAKRFAGTCRDFALLLCSLLRSTGTPARIRCGFAAYFLTGLNEDHWVAEYWHAEKGWTLVDAQLPAPELMEAFKISFDPMDVPRDGFLVAGKAWRACRSEGADPATYGVSTIGLSGMDFVQSNVVRDLAALNKVEVLPWDGWDLAERFHKDLHDSELKLLDSVAEAESDGGPFSLVRNLFLANPGLRTPSSVTSHTTYAGTRTVSLRS